MRLRFVPFPFLPVLALVPAPALADPLPAPVERMVEAAARSGDPAKISAVVAVAKETNPEAGTQIDAIVSRFAAEREAARRRSLIEGGYWRNWSGSGELGGSITTGNSDTVAVTARLTLRKNGIRWRHAFSALADLQRSDGAYTQERYALNYQADRDLGDRLVAIGALGWERNGVSGLRSRFTESSSLGYRVVVSPRFNWRIDAGPALRQARFTDRLDNAVALRTASDIRWTIGPRTSLSQTSTAYLDSTNSSSLITTTALTTGLTGKLSGKLSFNTQYESQPPDNAKRFDTVSRATLAYTF